MSTGYAINRIFPFSFSDLFENEREIISVNYRNYENPFLSNNREAPKQAIWKFHDDIPSLMQDNLRTKFEGMDRYTTRCGPFSDMVHDCYLKQLGESDNYLVRLSNAHYYNEPFSL